MMRTGSVPRTALSWPGSWPTVWPYQAAGIILLEGYERTLRRRAAYAAGRTEWMRRSAMGTTWPRRPRHLEVDVPDARSRHVDLPRGGRLFVHELAGPPQAPTVVLLHGWGGTAAGNWATAMPALARHFRVLAPDLRGHDAASVDDVIGLADALGVEQFIAVGYSLGSAVASQLARRHPDRVQGMVLCAAAGVAVPSPQSPGAVEIPTAVIVTRHDGIIPAGRQLHLARSLPGASVHPVEGNHLVFSQYEVFVPVLVDACQSVARRGEDPTIL